MTRGKILGILILLAMAAYGGQKAYVALTNRAPTKTTCADFVKSKSNAKWVELSDCDLDYPNAIQLESRILKVDKGVFVPVRPTGQRGPAPILLQLKTDDLSERVVSSLKQSLADSAKGETITGLVQFGMDSESKIEKAINKSNLKSQLAADYTLIEDGAKPDPFDAILGVVFIVGALLLIAVILRSSRRPPQMPPTPSTRHPPTSAAASTRRMIVQTTPRAAAAPADCHCAGPSLTDDIDPTAGG